MEEEERHDGERFSPSLLCQERVFFTAWNAVEQKKKKDSRTGYGTNNRQEMNGRGYIALCSRMYRIPAGPTHTHTYTHTHTLKRPTPQLSRREHFLGEGNGSNQHGDGVVGNHSGF